MNADQKIKVCFVCLGNICRSPLAGGLFEDLIREEELDHQIESHSAGTGHWHVGKSPDPRMMATARSKGFHLKNSAKQFKAQDFSRFDLVLAMDESNFSDLEQLGSSINLDGKLRLFRSFDPKHNGQMDVPDPYYGGDAGFEKVFDIVHRTCPEVLSYIKTTFLKDR